MIKLKKKICIVSIFGNYNFGNKLQNYALQKKCNEYGYITEILKISDMRNVRIKNVSIFKLVVEIKAFLSERIMKKWYRNKNFYDFEKKYLNNSKYYSFSTLNNKRLNDKYDYFIVGSDQVWNPNFGVKGDLTFLEFSTKPRIAFSASFGVKNIPEEIKEKYKKGIKALSYVSVREEEGKKIIKNLTNRDDVEVLIDPTMMLDKEKWQKISKKPNNLGNEKYILNYFLGNLSCERKNKINELAKKYGYRVINILDENDPFYNSGPSEFIYLEEHAELICTDSFHSCVFGIILNTPFIVFEREDKEEKMNSRIETLLAKFNLEERMYNGQLNESHLICDYSNTYKILKNERNKAEEFLKKSLGE